MTSVSCRNWCDASLIIELTEAKTVLWCQYTMRKSVPGDSCCWSPVFHCMFHNFSQSHDAFLTKLCLNMNIKHLQRHQPLSQLSIVPCCHESASRWVGPGVLRPRAARCQSCPWSGRRWYGRAPQRSSPCPGTFWSRGVVWTVHSSQHRLGRERKDRRKVEKWILRTEQRQYNASPYNQNSKIILWKGKCFFYSKR